MKILFYCGIHNLVNFSRMRPYYDVCYGFDANPEKVEHARKIFINDPNVHIIFGALMEKGGEEIEFTITTNWDPASSLGTPNPEFVHMSSGLLVEQKKITVPTVNLSDFCQSNNIQEIDTLITDLQGVDFTVLKTLTPFIRAGKIREIQCEVEPDTTPARYLEIPTGKLSEFTALLSDTYDMLWIDPPNPEQAETAWEMDVRWRVKGGQASDDIEFVMEHDMLVAKLGPNSSLATHSQYHEDLVIDALFSHKREGCYVDIGANDPDMLSNTTLFYNKGWHGINVEPEPDLHAKLCAQRPRDINLNVGAGPEPGVMTFYRMSAHTLSSFNKEAALQAGKLYGSTLVSEESTPVMRLDDILERNLRGREIDFLSVDAEGYDLAVLKSNDWSRFRPSVLIVEINVGGDEIIQFLQGHGYILIFNNVTNGIFVSEKFLATLDNSVRKDLAAIERKHNLETFFPVSSGKDNVVVNFVYGHMRTEDAHAGHRGNISMVWSSNPIDGCDVYVYQNAFSYKGKRGGIDILLTLEPVVVLPGEFDERVWAHFDYVLTLFDALAERGEKFRKINFPHFGGQLPVVLTENMEARKRLYPTSDRRNAICMINGHKQSSVPSELYSVRTEIAKWFDECSDIPFDVYGTPAFPLPNYKGGCEQSNKLSTLKQYRFCLCFENTNHPDLSAGYITEKILDCLETRTIPIYLGASNVEKYIPSGCFIDMRKFKDYPELDAYLHSLSDSEIQEYIDAIDAFVCSRGLKDFSRPALYGEVVKILVEQKLVAPQIGAQDTLWRQGPSPSLRRKEWKSSTVPTMWTWKHLANARSPLLDAEEMIVTPQETTARSQADAIVGHDLKSFTVSQKPAIKVVVAGLRFSYGNARRGYDYGWWNICDTLVHRFNNIQAEFFDYVTEAQQRGIAGMSDRLVDLVRKEQPDVLFYCPFDASSDILHESLRFITEHTNTKTMIWMSDDHWRFENYSRLWAPCVDHIITTATEAVEKYRLAGFGDKVIKSQWAFNPFTYQVPPDIARARDVSFVGMAHGNRPEIINTMRKNGLQVDVFGLGWSDDMDIPFQDMVRIFGESRINLNLSNSSTITTQQIKGRNFEIPGCGGFVLTTPAESLSEYYEPDKEVVIASSVEELIDKSRYYLVHEQKREKIARRASERTLAHHTWAHRLVDIFKHIGFDADAKAVPSTQASSFQLHLAGAARGAKPDAQAGAGMLSPSVETHNEIQASIIVTAYNQLHYTKQCVESILHYTRGAYELILVDNGSTDGTCEYFDRVQSFHHHTRVIKNFQNRNVEATCNYAYAVARGKYIVGATNDILVHEGWLENLIRHMESAQDVGVVGPLSNNISGPQAMQAEYDSLEAYQTFAAERGRIHRGEHTPVDRMVGMLIITKKSVFERIGAWDPELPTNGRDGGYGFSDDDFSLRLRLAGYRALVANDVFIHHFGSMTTRQHRPDLFGTPQNINKEKYLKKVNASDRFSLGPRGELTLQPYGPNDHIPVAENTIIRSPQVCIVINDAGSAKASLSPESYSAIAESYHGTVVSSGAAAIEHVLLQTAADPAYDFIALVDRRRTPVPREIKALIDTALCYPDIAVLVPVGNYAPSTHAQSGHGGKNVECIEYADLSVCVINVKLIRPFIQGLTECTNAEEFFPFLQRRVRGEGYFIAKANTITLDAQQPCAHHRYDAGFFMPERWAAEKNYAEAVALYKDDLRKDPTFYESLYQLALIAKEQRQFSSAIRYAREALQKNPHHIQSLLFLARIFLEQGDMSTAGEFVGLCNLKQPGHPDVQKIVERYEAQLKGQPGVSQAGAAEKSTGVFVAPESVIRTEDRIMDAELLISENRIAEAVVVLLEALEQEPDNIHALNDLAVTTMMMNNYGAATTFLGRVMALDPSDEIALENLSYLGQAVHEIIDDEKFHEFESFVGAGEFGKASVLLAGLRSEDPGSVDAQLEVAAK